MAYDNEKKGVLFKNDKKTTETHPDYTGTATIEGVEYFMDAWINASESGRKYMSFKFKAKQKQADQSRQAESQKPSKPARPNAGFDGEPPF